MNHRRTAPFFVPDYDYFDVTPHAARRMAQRNVSWEDIRFVLQYGQRTNKAGAIHVFLGTRDIPAGLGKRYARLEGTTVLVCPMSMATIITVYRNRQDGASRIRRKPKRSWKAQRRQPLYPAYIH